MAVADELRIQVENADGDEENLDSITRELLRELRDAGLGDVALASEGTAPPGSKGLGVIAIGQVLVNVLPSALPALIGFLQEWSLRGRGRTLKLKVKRGDDAVDIEYPVESLTEPQIARLAQQMVSALDNKRQGPGDSRPG